MGTVNRNNRKSSGDSETPAPRHALPSSSISFRFKYLSLVLFLPGNLADTSRPHPLASPHDGHAMLPRTLPSAIKQRVILNPPVWKRDASTSPGVGVKTRMVLPRLPVPPLRSTLDKYLQSIKPLLLEDDLRGISAFTSAYQLRVQWAKEFETGIGTTLQARLIGTRHFLSTFNVPIAFNLVYDDLQPWTKLHRTIGSMITSGYGRRISNGVHHCSSTRTGGSSSKTTLRYQNPPRKGCRRRSSAYRHGRSAEVLRSCIIPLSIKIPSPGASVRFYHPAAMAWGGYQTY